MKVVAKLYYFSPTSSIKNKFLDFEADINFGVCHKSKMVQTNLYPKNYYKSFPIIDTENIKIKVLLTLNEKFLTRLKRTEVVDELKNKIKN